MQFSETALRRLKSVADAIWQNKKPAKAAGCDPRLFKLERCH